MEDILHVISPGIYFWFILSVSVLGPIPDTCLQQLPGRAPRWMAGTLPRVGKRVTILLHQIENATE